MQRMRVAVKLANTDFTNTNNTTELNCKTLDTLSDLLRTLLSVNNYVRENKVREVNVRE